MTVLQHRASILAQRAAGVRWPDIARQLNVTTTGLRGMASRYGWTKKVRSADEDHPTPEHLTPLPDLPDLDELFRLARQSASVINRTDPVVTHHEIQLDAHAPVGVIFVSCAHLGGRYTFYQEFEQLFADVLGVPRLYWLSLGDDIEGFLSGFPDASAVTDQAIANPKVQRLMLAHVLDKLAERGKLLAGCASQHGGDWTRKRAGDDPIKDMYVNRGVPFFDGKALLTLRVGAQTYRVALAHEFPGSSIYNPNHAQRRAALFEYPNADIIVQGDKHRYAVTEMSLPPQEFDAGMRDSYMQWLVQVGTAKAGPDKYSIRGWSRGILEWPVLIMRHDRHFVASSRDMGLTRLMLGQW